MKKAFIIVFVISVLSLNHVQAQEDITGTWQGKLITGPGAEMTLQFIIKQENNGALSALLNSPDEGALKNIPASSINFDGKVLKIEVAEVEGRFEGQYKNKVIDGKWSQSGMSFPLSLNHYVKPQISQESNNKILGTWHGELTTPTAVLSIRLRFDTSEQGNIVGFLDMPEQGVYGVKVGDVVLKENDITVNIRPGSVFSGQLSGGEISGKWTGSTGQPTPLSLEKGEGDILKTRSNLSQESQNQLLGTWHGTISMPQSPLTIVFRFEKTKKGDFIGLLDIPNQGVSGAVISEIKLEQNNLTIKLNALNAAYTGQLSENKAEGKFTQGGRLIDLTLNKGNAPVIKLNIPETSMNQLLGKWQGILNSSQGSFMVAIRFEKTKQGELVGFYDNLSQSRLGFPIDKATFKQGALMVKINSIRLECKGNISGDTLSIQFTSSGRSSNAVLERNK